MPSSTQHVAASLLGGLLSLGCASAPAPVATARPASPAWLSDELAVVQSAGLEPALEKPFEYAVPVVHGQALDTRSASMTNCTAYFALKAQGFAAVSDQEHDLMRLEGVRCHALRMAAKLSGAACTESRHLLEATLSELPPSLGPSPAPSIAAQRESAARRGTSWADYAKGAKVVAKPDLLTIDEPEFVTELTPLASGDLNGDHKPDVLVRAVGYGHEGTWRDIRLLVLTRACDSRRYELVQTVLP